MQETIWGDKNRKQNSMNVYMYTLQLALSLSPKEKTDKRELMLGGNHLGQQVATEKG